VNILLLSDYYPPDKIGGVGEIAKNLRHSFEQKGHRVFVLTTGHTHDDPHVIRGSRSLIKGIFLNNFRALRIIRRHKIDVIHIHQATSTLFLLVRYIPFWYSRFPRVINSFQVSYVSEFKQVKRVKIGRRIFRPKPKEYIEKWLFAPIHIFLDIIGYISSDIISVVSSENKKEIARHYGWLVTKKIMVVPNGVNNDQFIPKRTSLSDNLLKRLTGQTVLLYIGVFRVRKRIFNLLLALKEVVKKHKKVLLVLIGGGRNYENDINQLVKELLLAKHIIFIGQIPNEQVADYLALADVFCLLSAYEGMPVALLEAMASGTAVLTSRVSGMLDLIRDEQDGYLVEVDNMEEITKQLTGLVEQSASTQKMGQCAKVHVMQNYDWKNIAEQYLNIFES